MEIPTTRTVVHLSEHCSIEERDGTWTCHFPVLDVTGTGSSKDEAFQAMVALLQGKTADDDALRETWEAWTSEHSAEEPVPEEEQQEMRSLLDRAKEASKGFPALTAASFDEAIGADTPVLVDIWADWCMPCHMLAPVLKNVADELAGRMSVAKLNADEHGEVSERLGIQGLPTMVLFRAGAELHRIVGAGRSKEQMIAELEPHL